MTNATESDELSNQALKTMEKIKKHPIRSTLLGLGWLICAVCGAIWNHSSLGTKLTILFSIIGLTFIAL